MLIWGGELVRTLGIRSLGVDLNGDYDVLTRNSVQTPLPVVGGRKENTRKTNRAFVRHSFIIIILLLHVLISHHTFGYVVPKSRSIRNSTEKRIGASSRNIRLMRRRRYR